jgi:hypothetical protein
LDQTFFGFSSTDQIAFHDHLFDLIWAGEGRWDLDTVYNLPIHLRKFWVTKINKLREKANESVEESRGKIKRYKS